MGFTSETAREAGKKRLTEEAHKRNLSLKEYLKLLMINS